MTGKGQIKNKSGIIQQSHFCDTISECCFFLQKTRGSISNAIALIKGHAAAEAWVGSAAKDGL